MERTSHTYVGVAIELVKTVDTAINFAKGVTTLEVDGENLSRDYQLSYCCTKESGICSPTSVLTEILFTICFDREGEREISCLNIVK